MYAREVSTSSYRQVRTIVWTFEAGVRKCRVLQVVARSVGAASRVTHSHSSPSPLDAVFQRVEIFVRLLQEPLGQPDVLVLGIDQQPSNLHHTAEASSSGRKKGFDVAVLRNALVREGQKSRILAVVYGEHKSVSPSVCRRRKPTRAVVELENHE